MRHLLAFFAIVFILSSCVPNRKFVYLQKDDVKATITKTDTVVRTYKLHVDEYKIQPLDLLYIKMESLTDQDFDFISKLYPINQGGTGGGAGAGNQQQVIGFFVDNNGEIEFPVLGKVKFSGLTIFEAQERMQEGLKPYLKNPVARVRLLNFRFTVLGEVLRENQVTSPNTRVTIMEAIGMAGGLSELADRSKVKVIRQVGNTSEVFYVNLLEESLIESSHYYIQQNDVIVVPALKQRPFRRYFEANVAIVLSSISLLLLVYNLSK